MFTQNELKEISDHTLSLIKNGLEKTKRDIGFLYPNDQKLLDAVSSEINERLTIHPIFQDLFGTFGFIFKP